MKKSKDKTQTQSEINLETNKVKHKTQTTMGKSMCNTCNVKQFKKDLKKIKVSGVKGKQLIEPTICKICWTEANPEITEPVEPVEVDGFIDCDASDSEDQFNPITDDISDDEVETEVIEPSSPVSSTGSDPVSSDFNDPAEDVSFMPNPVEYIMTIDDPDAKYTLTKQQIEDALVKAMNISNKSKPKTKKSPKVKIPADKKASAQPVQTLDGKTLKTISSFRFAITDSKKKDMSIRFETKKNGSGSGYYIEYSPYYIANNNEKTQKYIAESKTLNFGASGVWSNSTSKLPGAGWELRRDIDYVEYDKTETRPMDIINKWFE